MQVGKKPDATRYMGQNADQDGWVNQVSESAGAVRRRYLLSKPPYTSTHTRFTNIDSLPQHGLSRKHIFESIKASLKRLDLEYVDVLQCHRFDPETPIEETMQALHDVVQAGYARYIGMSSCWAYQFAQMQNYAIQKGLTPFISMQVSGGVGGVQDGVGRGVILMQNCYYRTSTTPLIERWGNSHH